MPSSTTYFCVTCTVLLLSAAAAGQQRPASSQPTAPSATAAVRGEGAAAAASLPSGYVIGASDVLSVVFWRDKDMSADVTVRPDGNISLPLLNDVVAAGYTPDQLRARLVEAASKYIEDPNATVVVK